MPALKQHRPPTSAAVQQALLHDELIERLDRLQRDVEAVAYHLGLVRPHENPSDDDPGDDKNDTAEGRR